MNSNPVASPVSGPIATTPETRRVLSVDALRGFDMFWILGADALMGALKKMAEGSTGPAASVARPITTRSGRRRCYNAMTAKLCWFSTSNGRVESCERFAGVTV